VIRQRPRVVLVGTGGLATAIAHSLACLPGRDLEVEVVGRRADPAEQLCLLAAARAAAVGAGTRFTPRVTDLSADRPRLWQERPDLVVVVASAQSPWEAQREASAWTDLVRCGGFGVTLPFQADLAGRVARVAADEGVRVVNGCLPDVVNPVLAASGTPVVAGLGNGATIHAFVRAAAGRQDVRILAHHYHLHVPEPGELDAWVVADDGESLDATTLLRGLRGARRDQLNHVTGLVSAQAIRALVDESTSLSTTLPGVHDRQGGLPVRITGGQVTPDLPATWIDSAVRAANDAWSLADGACVRDGSVTLSARAIDALSAHLDGLPASFAVSDLPAFATTVSQLRDRLRHQPSGDKP
jgi:hypothetical protein